MEKTMKNFNSTTIYFLNANGKYEANSIFTSETGDVIIVGTIFKDDLKGTARGYIVYENDDIDYEDQLGEILEPLQNTSFVGLTGILKDQLGIECDLIAERNSCRTAIRNETIENQQPVAN